MAFPTKLDQVPTPAAIYDREKSQANINRLQEHLYSVGGGLVRFRPHVKTIKSLEAARLFGSVPGPITVSTLAEAEYFADGGYTDILYAVGIAPPKFDRVARLYRRGVDLALLVDSREQAEQVCHFARSESVPATAFIEIDVDSHRGGLTPQNPELIAVASVLAAEGALAGVLAHAGESYSLPARPDREQAAETERVRAVAAAEAIRAAGIECPNVSIGSTPTAHAYTDLTGITEVRAGNLALFDLFMAGINVCSIDDIALSVLVTVIGHQKNRGWILTDGGWMALSRDRGTANQQVDQGYGLVADKDGNLIEGLYVSAASQEHGIIEARGGAALPDLPIGTQLRIVPNHACATAGQFDHFWVLDTTLAPDAITDRWHRTRGW